MIKTEIEKVKYMCQEETQQIVEMMNEKMME